MIIFGIFINNISNCAEELIIPTQIIYYNQDNQSHTVNTQWGKLIREIKNGNVTFKMNGDVVTHTQHGDYQGTISIPSLYPEPCILERDDARAKYIEFNEIFIHHLLIDLKNRIFE